MIISGEMGDMGFSWGDLNPVKYVEKGASALYSGVKAAGYSYNPGVLLTKAAIHNPRETLAIGIVGAGAAAGIPPTVTGPLAIALIKSGGKIPPGTDPAAAAAAQAYLRDHPELLSAAMADKPWYENPWILGGGAAAVLLGVVLLAQRR